MDLELVVFFKFVSAYMSFLFFIVLILMCVIYYLMNDNSEIEIATKVLKLVAVGYVVFMLSFVGLTLIF